ncbi:hypothetical protein ABBQ32_012792 [Trebouxia sp. C0010 RCD-2024]
MLGTAPQKVSLLTQVAPAMFEEDEEQQQGVGPLKAALEEAAAAAEAQGRSKQPGARRNSHKPNEVLELQQFKGNILANPGAAPNTLASKCVGPAPLPGGGGTPRNTALGPGDTQGSGDLVHALHAVTRQPQASSIKPDVNGNLLQSFRNMDVTTGPAGKPRSTANTGDT